MIYIECYADEVLIKSILSNITRKEYAHSGNKAAVIKQLIKQNDEISKTSHMYFQIKSTILLSNSNIL